MAIYGKGIYEKGKYKSKNGQKHTKEYLVWRSMISRCYNTEYLKKHPTYEKCEVCDDWLYFQNFCKWFSDNYYEIKNETINLDKDFLSIMNNLENKIYSPQTCMFVPQEINKAITFQKHKTKDLPTGVKETKNKNKYNVLICIKSKKISNKKDLYIGHFNNKEEAFKEYVIAKKKYMKDILNSYENIIPNKVYENLDKFINGNYLQEIYNK